MSLESLNDWLYQSTSQHRCSGYLGTHLRTQPPRWPLSYAPRCQGLWFRLCPISTHFTVVLGWNSMHDAGWTQQKVTAWWKGKLGRMEELAAENVTGRDLSMISHNCSRGLPPHLHNYFLQTQGERSHKLTEMNGTYSCKQVACSWDSGVYQNTEEKTQPALPLIASTVPQWVLGICVTCMLWLLKSEMRLSGLTKGTALWDLSIIT